MTYKHHDSSGLPVGNELSAVIW